MRSRLSACTVTVLLASGVPLRADPADREAVVRALLARSRLLADVRFRVPLALYRDFRRDTIGPGGWTPPAPVPAIAQEGVYRLKVGSGKASTISAAVRLHVLSPRRCRVRNP